MILGVLTNANSYNALNSGFALAFEFLRRDDLADLTEGKHEIDVYSAPGRIRSGRRCSNVWGRTQHLGYHNSRIVRRLLSR